MREEKEDRIQIPKRRAFQKRVGMNMRQKGYTKKVGARSLKRGIRHRPQGLA